MDAALFERVPDAILPIAADGRIARSNACARRGELVIESRLGDGTQVVWWLPVSEGAFSP
jgi:hypothetical protein